MGSDLRLTGLASGMDWQPIVDKLLELEAIPKQRLESEKQENNAKVSDLGTLKSQLTALKNAASALQDDGLFDRRKVNIKDSSGGLSATAGVGALIGDFSIKLESLSSRTQVSSKNRTNSRLSAGIDPTKPLSELALHTPISTGTFTVSGKTFNINSLDITLQELFDKINEEVVVGSGVTGVNPESDSSGIIFAYNPDTDKVSLNTTLLPQDSLNLTVLGSSTDSSNFLQAIKLIGSNSEPIIESTIPLGSIDMTVSLANCNFASGFEGLSSGLGNFFIGEGEGTVRIDYDINNDSLSDIIERINNSSGNVHMFYDPVGDRFVVRNKSAGAIGIVMHESSDWDSISSANSGNGNLLSLMGLAPPSEITDSYNPSVDYSKGDFVEYEVAGVSTYWQAFVANPTEPPSAASEQWFQVIPSVVRTLPDELGQNSSIRINDGELIYSSSTTFSSNEHGYEGITFNMANVSIGASVEFSVSRDFNGTKSVIDKFVEEFNDAQDYISSLTRVDQNGEDVTSSRFTGNQEINRLASELRRAVFGSSYPHSESASTSDSANLTIGVNNSDYDEINAISNQMNFDSSDEGYIIKVLNQEGTGNSAYFEWDGSTWQETSPTFSVFRLSNIGLDFGISSNNLNVTDSSLLLKELESNPDKVKALFSEIPVEDSFDIISQTNRSYKGITYTLNDYIDNFLTGDEELGYKGAYQSFLDSIESRNERIDEKMESIDEYLESRERILSEGFMRMEEMQSKMDSQMQTLQNSFLNKK